MKAIFCLCIVLIGAQQDASWFFTKERAHPMKDNGNIFLVSYPHSGSHWLVHLIQHLNHEVWRGPRGPYSILEKDAKNNERLFKTHKWKEPNILYNHIRDGLEYFTFDMKKDYLVLLLRNYKRHLYNMIHKKGLFTSSEESEKIVYEYYHLLELFERWPASRKVCIYYEDLCENPKQNLTRLIPIFRNYTSNSVEELLKHPSFHVKRSKDRWNTWHNKKTLQSIDNYVMKKNKNLFKKYLWIYMEK